MPSSQFVLPFELNENNIISAMEDTYQRYAPVEQIRWSESNTDTRFWAGDQDYCYNWYGGVTPQTGWKRFFFNIIQQPCNMVTGYQRQHRKNFNAVPVENSDQKTADQFNRILTYACSKNYLLETYSDSCEQSLVNGMNLMQPYLDYTQDPINGDLKYKIWEYNSFICDPFFRDSGTMSDANMVWTQEFLSKKQAMLAFPKFRDMIASMSGYQTAGSKFYFLPENYNISVKDLLILSRYWYKTTRRKKMLFNEQTGEVTDFLDADGDIKDFVKVYDELQIVEREVPTWHVATVLNRQLLYMGPNPLGFDECPFVPVFWNRDPYITQPSLRVRSLVRSLRDANFLFNRRVILNHDISESSLNSGWLMEEDSVANQEVMKMGGQGQNIEVKTGTQRWPEKIIPQAVPPSDLQLADQLLQIIPALSGVNEELLGMSTEKGLAGITQMLRQGAGLVTLQKYFDQWDRSLKQLGILSMRIVQNKWLPFKIGRILGEEPTEQFFTKAFQQYDVLAAEGLNTTVQRQAEFAQLLEFQQVTGIQIPPKLLIDKSTFQGKDDLVQALEKQQAEQAEMQQQQMQLEMTKLETELEVLKATAAEKLALAKERVGRTKSNIGLYEERISEMTENRARAVKEKVGALKEFIETLDKYGEMEMRYGAQAIGSLSKNQSRAEEMQKDRKDPGDSTQSKSNEALAFLQQLQGAGQNQPNQMEQ